MRVLITIFLFIFSHASLAKLTVTVNSVSQPKQVLGTIEFTNTRQGLLITPHLKQLSPGLHGLHVHKHPVCDHDGHGAGGHLDPKNTEKHLGPYNQNGHLGDLPALYAAEDGTATLPTLAPRLTEHDLIGHAIIIHGGGDNYADTPQPLGGGNTRIACGIVVNPTP